MPSLALKAMVSPEKSVSDWAIERKMQNTESRKLM